VRCNVTRIASSAGGKCLQGYRLTPGLVALGSAGGRQCDMALDVVMYNVGNLSIEASTLIFDPYKLTAIGYQHRACYVNSQPDYGLEDVRDMNQVTRRGANWRNLVASGVEDKSVEFSDGPHDCVAIHKSGPSWRGGYVYMLHASICRTDTTTVRPEDVADALGALQIRHTIRKAICAKPAARTKCSTRRPRRRGRDMVGCKTAPFTAVRAMMPTLWKLRS
jgi:hypothetical protein